MPPSCIKKNSDTAKYLSITTKCDLKIKKTDIILWSRSVGITDMRYCKIAIDNSCGINLKLRSKNPNIKSKKTVATLFGRN